jgi:N-acetylmuramoyl-L-alanine amidase
VRVRNLRSTWVALLALWLFLAGCAAHSRHNTSRAPNWSLEGNVPPPQLKTDSSILAAPSTVQSVSIPEEKSASTNKEPRWTNETWVSLARWCQSNGLPAPVLLSAGPVAKYQLATSNGNFRFSTGSRLAHWESTDVRLGFAPQWIDRQPFLHGLDLRKTLVPLIAKSASFSSNSFPILVLDAGHGGEDGGAKSAVESSWEKQFTLDWARRVQALLITNGWQVFLTRTNDQEMALSNRVSFAEQHRADLFLSLHFNSAGTNASQAGLETYCLTPRGMPSTITRDYYDDTAAEYPNNAFDEKNFQLAIRLHRILLEANGHVDRGVRRARFPGVLRGQQRPAILIEGGYLSNPGEARLIAQPAYRQKLAEALARGLMGLIETQKLQSSSSGGGEAIHSIN